jgi:Exo-beta-D-glucosaminidase Ig-fold domain
VLGNKSNWYMTAVKTYANLTGLNGLPSNSGLTATPSRTVSGGQETVQVYLTNTSATNIAFFVRPEVTAGNSGPEVLPVNYTDNYISLWPGETTTITPPTRLRTSAVSHRTCGYAGTTCQPCRSRYDPVAGSGRPRPQGVGGEAGGRPSARRGEQGRRAPVLARVSIPRASGIDGW